MLGVLLLTAGIVVAYTLYKLSKNNAKYFEERKLKYINLLDFLKEIIFAIFGRVDVLTMATHMYNALPDVP